MKKLIVVGIVLIVVIAALGIFIFLNYMRELDSLKHETNRWAVIKDVNGDKIAVETVSDEVWAQLVQLNQNGSERFVGGIVVEYDNKWGFRFNPNTVTVAEVTAEGLQATIRYISENLDYWLGGWAYVYAKVTEVHSKS
jgi:hypothetical protein